MRTLQRNWLIGLHDAQGCQSIRAQAIQAVHKRGHRGDNNFRRHPCPALVLPHVHDWCNGVDASAGSWIKKETD